MTVSKVQILNDNWVVNLKTKSKPKWRKMIFRNKSYYSLQDEVKELKMELHRLTVDVKSLKYQIETQDFEIQVLRSTVDRKDYYLQSLEFSVRGNNPRSNEDLEKDGYKCVNIIDKPRFRLWVK